MGGGKGPGQGAGSVGGIDGVDIAVHLMSERDPGLLGEVHPCPAANLPLAAPGGCGGEARVGDLPGGCCLLEAPPALTPLFAAPVPGKTLQDLHTHGPGEAVSEYRRKR